MAVDRQSLIFFIIMFIFLTLPNGNEQPHSYQERQTLTKFQQSLKSSHEDLINREYESGYGNLTGFHLSYDDMINDKKVEDWPIHKYDKDHPWMEDEKYSILPNLVSDKVKKFWGVDKVDLNNDEEFGYLFNISGRVNGKFKKDDKIDSKIKEFPLKLPKYLEEYFEAINAGEFDNGDDNGDNDNNNNDALNDYIGNKVGNITYDEGLVGLSIKSLGYNYKNPELLRMIKTEDRVEDAVMVELKLTLSDNGEVDKNEIDTYGIYFQESGSLLSITSTGKFLGNSAAPSLTMNKKNFDKTKKLIIQLFNGTDFAKQISMDDMNSHIGKSFEQCEFINYIQFEKTEYLVGELKTIDEELMNPSGKPIGSVSKLPKIRIKDMLIYSPDCGIVINNNGIVEGEKTEILTYELRNVLIGFAVLVGLQLYLFLNEINYCKTPGQLSNISSLTLILIQFQDAIISLIFLLISTIFEKLYLLLVCIAIFTYILCGIFEMGFLTKVIKTQINERGTTWWEILRGASSQSTNSEVNTGSNNENGNVRTDGEGLPLPVTAGPPNTTTPANANANANTPAATTTTTTPIITEGEDATVWNSIFAPGFAITIISVFLILNSTMWRKSYRKVFEIIGLTLFNSYWIPQFFRNTLKNRKVPFTWRFIIGTTIIRLIPIIYLNIFNNPFKHGKNYSFLIFLIFWNILQLFLIYLQNFNPRFWINDKWLPKAYNYYPIINISDLEHYGSDLLSNINITESETQNEHELEHEQDNERGNLLDDETIVKTDCAICMTSVNLPIYKNSKKKNNNSKKEYMVTPCFHIFHSECLEDWMKYKLQCPICRNGLPPL